MRPIIYFWNDFATIKFFEYLLRSRERIVVVFKCLVQPCWKIGTNPNLIRLFPHIDCWRSPLAEICLRRPAFSNLFSSSFICSRAAKGTFRFFWIWAGHGPLPRIVLSFLHIFQGRLKTPRNFLSFYFNFSVLVLGLFKLWQNVLIGQSQRLNFSLQSVPNRLSVFFRTYAISFFIMPFKVTVRTTSPGARTRLLAFCKAPGTVLDFGPERGSGKGTMADLGPLIRHLVSTRLPSGGRAALLSPLSPVYGTRPSV